jgi:hypothetical protein
MVILLIIIGRHQGRLFGQYIPLSARSLIPSLLPRGEGNLEPPLSAWERGGGEGWIGKE